MSRQFVAYNQFSISLDKLIIVNMFQRVNILKLYIQKRTFWLMKPFHLLIWVRIIIMVQQPLHYINYTMSTLGQNGITYSKYIIKIIRKADNIEVYNTHISNYWNS